MFKNLGSLADAVKKVKLAMYTSDLSDIEDKKTKTNNHTSEKKRKDISLSSKSSSEQLSKLFTVTMYLIEILLVFKDDLYLTKINYKLNLKLS